MVGTLFQLTVAALLAATPAGGFTPQGREASARTTSPVGFFAQGAMPYPSQWERGYGSASLSAEDRVSAVGASYGDKAQFEAELRLGEVRYRVELNVVGFPPVQASGATAVRLDALRPGFPVGGGVILDHDLNGASGLGWPVTTQVHAAVVVWGVGSVWRNEQLITDSAVIQAAALSAGAQADDETHSTLAVARPGDLELDVLVWNLPRTAEPRGFLQFSFDDVEIEVAGQSVPSVAVLPSEANPEAGGAMQVAGGFGQSAVFLPPLPPSPPPREGVGGSGFDVTAQPETGQPGGPVTPVGPTTLSGPASPNPTAVPGLTVGTTATREGTVPGVPGVPVAPTVPPEAGTTPVGPGAITPDTISGTFPTLGAPTPPVNISGVVPGTPAPGSELAEQDTVTPGAPPPGAGAETGVATSSPPVAQSTVGAFTVPISPPSFTNFAGTGQVSPGIIATPPPLGINPATPTPPLLGSPAPLTAAPATPLLGTPAPLNVAPPPALITTPAPANAVPGAPTATPPATPVGPGVAPPPGPAPVTPGGTAVPPSI